MPFRLLFLLLLLPLAVSAQQAGCPDPRATNYAPGATVNDGSCQYAPTSAVPATRAVLPADVEETSGLQQTGAQLWTHNDSGNSPTLFRLDAATGAIVQRVHVRNFPNVDWEDLAADAQYLYIGDFGNNFGNRTDLRILRVRRADIGTRANDTVSAQAIQFSYPDQTNFNPGLNNHNFDCEAFFVANDSLHLFTKNWADQRTTYYTVPATPGTYVARRRASFNAGGLITAADLSPAGTEAALLGYDPAGNTFVWLLSDFAGGRYFGGNKRRINLPNALAVGQVEGLTFAGPYQLLLSNERFTVSVFTVPPRLYELNAGAWLAPALGTAAPVRAAQEFTVFPNPAGRTVQLRREQPLAAAATGTVHDAQGRLVQAFAWPAGQLTREIRLTGAAAGLYVVRVSSAAGVFSCRFVVEAE